MHNFRNETYRIAYRVGLPRDLVWPLEFTERVHVSFPLFIAVFV